MASAPDPGDAGGPEVARVVVDVPLAHLDRVFDYRVPEALHDAAVPGARVRVRFAGRLVDGIVLDRGHGSEHRLQPLQRVVSTGPVTTPEILAIARAVSDRYGGTLADVLRQAIPPRHARAESRVLQSVLPSGEPDGAAEPAGAEADGADRAEADRGGTDRGDRAAWARYRGGVALLDRLGTGDPVRGVWNPLPGEDVPARLAELASAVARRGGSVVVVVPDARDVARFVAAFRAHPGCPGPAVLAADQGPEARYASFLRVLTGRSRVVIGTRAAAFAPVDLAAGPGLLICWEDGEDTLAEPHAPGWHAREVLALRAHASGASLLVGGFARSVESQSWIETGWAAPVVPQRDALRAVAPRVLPEDDPGRDPGPRRLPGRALEVIRAALRGSGDDGGAPGPVLVQVARRGYLPGLACQDCRRPARCHGCGGGLVLAARSATPTCASCGVDAGPWTCPGCGSGRLRAVAVGSERTAEELQRAFPDVPVSWSGGGDVLDRVPATGGIVVATPGAEPWPDGGYAAAILLDAWAQVARADLRAGEETVRRWFRAAALVRPRAPVVVTAAADLPAVQALVRWDPGWFAARDLAERTALGLPPARRAGQATGSAGAVAEALAALASLGEEVRVLGPVPLADALSPPSPRSPRSAGADPAGLVRAHVTVPRERGPDLADAWGRVAAERSARKAADRLDLRIDPPGWGSA